MGASEDYPGVIFLIIGPGGAGKNAIMNALFAEMGELRQLATATTRAMRSDEKQGREHLFLDKAQFAQMLERGELLEHQEVTPGKYYGIPRQTVVDGLEAGLIRLADIDVLGAEALAQHFPRNVVQIFVTVPGAQISEQLRVLRRRMKQRADADTDIEERLERAISLELPYQDICDYVVVNGELTTAIEATRRIIQRELRTRQLSGAPS